MGEHERWLWLGGSLLAAVLWANLAWFLRPPPSDAKGKSFLIRLRASVSHLAAWRFSPWLLQILRLLYYVGLPTAALLSGHDAIVETFLGLKFAPEFAAKGGIATADRWLDWAHGLGWAVTLGVGAWALLAVGWWAYRRALAAVDTNDNSVAGRLAWGWVLLREAIYHEFHWAFYRNAFIVVWGEYWGIWSGLAPVGLEAALNPAWRTGLANPQKAPAQLMRGALAVISGVLFLLTHNLWLAIVVHWGVSWGLAALANARRET